MFATPAEFSLLLWLCLPLSYLLGSIPTGSWLARRRGIDLKRVGSGNSGATNVQRTLGWGPALFVAAFDAAKGALAVWLTLSLGGPDWLAALAGLAAVLGHNYSAFLGFKGGKGVATSLGTVLAIAPSTGLVVLVVAAFTMWATRMVSAGSLVGAVTAVSVSLALGLAPWLILVVSVLSGLILWQHRDNWQRLQSGTERRIGDKAKAAEQATAQPEVLKPVQAREVN